MSEREAVMEAIAAEFGACSNVTADAVIAALDSARAPVERITHGRHCTCSPCARENWGDPSLSHCGMHGPSCPGVYAPLGPAGSPVPASAQQGGTDV